ncbi:MAG: hypothetical protein DRN20_06670, partial [Thermoplasmata archaeon]
MQEIINRAVKAVLEKKKKVFPVHVNRISQLGSPCLRYLYYLRTAWDKQQLPEDSLQGRFETGNHLEGVIDTIVQEVGEASEPQWRIVGQQMP